jgi:4-nitrophenyl phosphatase
LDEIRALIIDMDGVLWRGNQTLPGVADFFEFLRANSIRFLLATNNAARTTEYYVERLRQMGLEVARDQILTSSEATARWLKEQVPNGTRVYVVGEEGLIRALADADFKVVADGAELVVVGLDRTLTYDKLRRATLSIRAGARFVATNGDVTFPAEEGLVPGAGSIVAALVAATGVKPTVIGKPHRPMFDAALQLLGTDPAHTAMLGDRLDTDIEGAQAARLKTLLVLTGVTTAEEAEASETRPDFIFSDLVELRRAWEASLEKASETARKSDQDDRE